MVKIEHQHDAVKLSLEAIGLFIEASEEIRFASQGRDQVYGWAERCWSSRGTPSKATQRVGWCSATSRRWPV
jgi:hypothetical protein